MRQFGRDYCPATAKIEAVTYLINLVKDIYAGDVHSAALYAVNQVIHITVFLEVNVCIMDFVF